MKKVIIFILLTLSFALKGTLINVNIDGSGDYIIIQQGIEAAVNGDSVLVAPGIYEENINLLGKKITVASEYLLTGNEEDIENTIIDGGGVDTVVRMDSGEDTLSYLCGFVLRNGNNPWGGGIYIYQGGAKLEHLKVRDNISESQNCPNGGGIYADGDIYLVGYRQIILRNVEIDNNTVIGNFPIGGGLFFRNKFNTVILENVSVTNNHCEGNSSANSGGMIIYNTSNVILKNCIIDNNSVSGYNDASCGGLSFSQIDELLIEDCQITNNSVESDWSVIGGMSIVTDGNVVIKNSLIADNSVLGFSSSGSGGATLSSGNFLVENCEVKGNSVRFYSGEIGVGGGLCFSLNCKIIINKTLIYDNTGNGAASYSVGSDCLLINSVIFNNHSSLNGGFYANEASSFRVVNSIFWNNENCEMWIEGNTDFQIYHSIIEDGEDGIECHNGADYFWGEGNLDTDPMFADAFNNDFHLLEGSPGIDSGVNACQKWGAEVYLIPEAVISGKNRDIGIYETGNEVYHFDLPAYLVTDEDITLSLDLEDYMEGMTGTFTASCENNLESVIMGNIISWQPEENWSGFDEVWVDFETDSGETYSDYVLIQVTSVDDAPVMNLPEMVSFNNIGEYRLDIMQYIYDIEGQLIRLSEDGSEHITAEVLYPYLDLEAEPGWQGTEEIIVYAEDGWERLISCDTMQVEVYCEPIADCGEDLYARDGETVFIDGSNSLDPLLNGLSYHWSTDNELIIENADSVLAIANMPEIEEMTEALIYLEINDGYNTSIDSLYLTYWDDEPLNAECDMFPANNTIRIFWDEPLAAGCEQIELLGYQMYFEGCEYDTLQNINDRLYTFDLPEGNYNFGVQSVYSDGASEIVPVSSTDTDESELIALTGLKRIYPNPFNPEVNIEFELAKSEKVLLEIYNIKGQKIRTLVDDVLARDNYSVIWKGDDENGNIVSSGIYFVRLKAGDKYLSQQKLTVIK